MQKQQRQIPVELDEKASEGIYSNFVLVTHTASEFVIDFARMLPGLKKAKVFSRIVMTPQTTKSLHMLLGRTIEKFESSFGKIPVPPQKGTGTDEHAIGFQAGIPGEEDKKGK